MERLWYFSPLERLFPQGIPLKKTILLLAALCLAQPALRADGAAPAETGGRQKERKAHVGRAFIEMGINWTYSAYNYWRKYAKFVEDWQFELTWKDQRRKWFTSEGLRLDSNNFRLNWTHAWSGAIYYSWARSNRLGPFPSFLFSFGGSLLWEYIAEWREISSINDHVFTAVGGPAIGEPLFQIGDHFRSRPGWANRVATFLVNPLLAFNDLLDGRDRLPRVPGDGKGDFRISFGWQYGPVSGKSERAGRAALDIDLRLVTLPGYGRAGSGSGWAPAPVASEFRIHPLFNAGGFEELAGSTRVVFAGLWRRDVAGEGDGRLHGSELWLGPAMGWELILKDPVVPYDGNDLGMIDRWFRRERPTRFTDKQSLIHLLGPAAGWTGYAGRLQARAEVEALLDFGLVNSLPFNDYTALHDPWGAKTTLNNWGYYYSLGYTVGGRVDVRRGGLRLEAGARYQRFRSIQGLDRYQGDILDDSPLRDSRFAYDTALSLAVPRTPLFLAFRLEGIDRWGQFHEVSRRARETRFSCRLGVAF